MISLSIMIRNGEKGEWWDPRLPQMFALRRFLLHFLNKAIITSVLLRSSGSRLGKPDIDRSVLSNLKGCKADIEL